TRDEDRKEGRAPPSASAQAAIRGHWHGPWAPLDRTNFLTLLHDQRYIATRATAMPIPTTERPATRDASHKISPASIHIDFHIGVFPPHSAHNRGRCLWFLSGRARGDSN